jgi:hypothetical protein
MFDTVSEAAERLATSVSRRAFMGGLGKGALALAGAIGAILTIPGLVQAGHVCPCGGPQGTSGGWVCTYACPDGSTMTVAAKAPSVSAAYCIRDARSKNRAVTRNDLVDLVPRPYQESAGLQAMSCCPYRATLGTWTKLFSGRPLIQRKPTS